jgi:hypothetical protein
VRALRLMLAPSPAPEARPLPAGEVKKDPGFFASL